MHDSVSFEILDLKKREGAFHGKYVGVVQPVLKWATECLEEETDEEQPGERELSISGAVL